MKKTLSEVDKIIPDDHVLYLPNEELIKNAVRLPVRTHAHYQERTE